MAYSVPWDLGWDHTGLSRRLMGQLSAIASTGVEVELYSRGEEDDYGLFSNKRVGGKVFGGDDPAIPLLNSLSFALAFSDMLGEVRADLLHCFNMSASFIEGKDYVLQMLNPGSAFVKEMLAGEYPDGGAYAKKLDLYDTSSAVERRECARAKAIIASSEMGKRSLIRDYGIPEWKITTIPTGVWRREVETGYDKEPGSLRIILFPNRLSVLKGFRYMAEAMREIRRSFPNALLLVTGRADTMDYEVVQPYLRGLREMGCISMAGYVSRGRLRELYKSADVVVVPSLCDDLSLSLLDAIATSTPIVATENTGFTAIDKVGIKVPPKDSGAIAGAVIDLLSDAGLYREKREMAEQVISRYVWEKIGAEYLQLYSNLA